MSWDFGDSLGPWGRGGGDEAREDVAEVDERPIRKGGGPPGRSAFLPGGRLSRLGKHRTRTTEPVREPVVEPAMSAFRPAAEESAFRPVEDWIADPLPRTDRIAAFEPFDLFDSFDPAASADATDSTGVTDGTVSSEAPGSGGWDPFADASFGEPVAESQREPDNGPTPTPTPEGGDAVRQRAFPGGRAKLPRLTPSKQGPEYDFVSTAFIPNTHADDASDQGARTGFHGYNTYESLFQDDRIADPLTTPVDDDAYSVLGVQPDDEWKVIVRAHRQLVKANHPDHLVGAPAAERQAAEERLRQINLAYREIKEDRRNDDGSAADESDEA